MLGLASLPDNLFLAYKLNLSTQRQKGSKLGFALNFRRNLVKMKEVWSPVPQTTILSPEETLQVKVSRTFYAILFVLSVSKRPVVEKL